jgi:hypothetical protein
MDPRLKEFVDETQARYGTGTSDWRQALFPEVSAREWVDTALLGGESVRDIVNGVGAGHVSDANLDPRVVEAFHLQFPSVKGELSDFIRHHPAPEQVQGIFSGVKGKLFEISHADYLNSHVLPEGYVARLAASPTQPGYDIVIEGPDHHYDYLQDKFTDSMSILREAVKRWPDIDIAVPHEVAAQVKDPDLITHVIDTGISGDDLANKVGHSVDLAGADYGWHFPWLLVAFIAGEEGWRSWKGKKGMSHFLAQAKRRLTRSVMSNLTGQALAIASGEPELCLVSVPLRLLWARYDVAQTFGQRIDSALVRIRSLAAAFAAGPAKRLDCLAQARINQLVGMAGRG